MPTWRRLRWSGGLLCLLCLLPLRPLLAQAQLPSRFTIVDLGERLSSLSLILEHESNRVLAAHQTATQEHLVQLYPSVADLGAPEAGRIDQVRAARGGWVVGQAIITATDGTPRSHAFVRTPEGLFQVLAPPAGGTTPQALAVNTSQIGGACAVDDRVLACRWDVAGTPTVLPALGPQSSLVALNVAGDGAGHGVVEGRPHCAFWPQAGGVVDCHPAQAHTSTARALNGAGTVVGRATFKRGHWQAFSATGSAATVLPPLGEAKGGQAYDINDAGLIVGESFTLGKAGGSPNMPQVAVVWEHGSPLDLQPRLAAPLGWTLERALAISETNHILVEGMKDGTRHVGILVPAPPPREERRQTPGLRERGPRR
jgi:hypothetical protein